MAYYKKHTRISYLGEEKKHGVSERTDESSDHINSGSPYSAGQKNTGAPEWQEEQIPQTLLKFSLLYGFQYRYFKTKNIQYEHRLQETLSCLNIHGACHFYTFIFRSH